jgi:hypothetical protein
MRASDLPKDLQKRLLGKTVSKIREPNEGELLFRQQCKLLKLPPVAEQYHFAITMNRRFVADFCFVRYGLIVEICGGLWVKGGGAHSRPAKIEKDIERQQYAALLGFWMLPFTPDDVFSGHAIDWTQKVLAKLGWKA